MPGTRISAANFAGLNLWCSACGENIRSSDAALQFRVSRYTRYAHERCIPPGYDMCPVCERVRLATDMVNREGFGSVCRPCADDIRIVECSECHTHWSISDTHAIRPLYPIPGREDEPHPRVCQDCMIRCDNCGRYNRPSDLRPDEHNRNRPMCPHCYMRRYIIRSHSFDPMTVLNFRGQNTDGFYMGVELEVEASHGKTNVEIAERMLRLLGNFVVIKHDGSLVNGFELVSCPATIEEHVKGWAKLFRPDDGQGRLNLVSWNSPRCGMHVHMSRAAIPPLHLARMMTFVYSRPNRQLIETVAGRNLHSGWAERYTEINSARKITDIVGVQDPEIVREYNEEWVRIGTEFMRKEDAIRQGLYSGKPQIVKKTYSGADNRYTALNDTNTNTVELRIFRGTLYEPSFYKNLEFCHAMWRYTKPGVTSLKDLDNPARFVEFVQKNSSEYRNLHRFLIKNKLANKGGSRT